MIVRVRRLNLTWAVLWLALCCAAPALAQEHQPAGSQAAPGAGHEQPAGEAHAQPEAVAEGHTADEEHAEGLLPTVFRVLNFAILVGILAYFLRSPIAGYLQGRSEQIRVDLVNAADARRTAERQLAEIDTRMQALPGELDALRTRGADEVKAEEARIRAAAEAERERLIEQMHREIDRQVRLATRDLRRELAELATGIARRRIQHTITPADHARLLDRYATQVEATR